MKELSIEEKAKRYDEAFKEASIAYKDEDKHLKATLKRIFSELAESEDERIRKGLINYFNDFTLPTFGGLEPKKVLAWLEKQGEPVEMNPTEFDSRLQALIGKFDSLSKEELIGCLSFWMNVVQNDGTYKSDEKQGEQKSADKVEPKFKVGQTIKKEGFNLGFTIVKIEDGFYYNNMGDYFPFTGQDNWELVEQKPTEWDDDAIAKLADEYEETLRKESNMSENMAHHCRLAFFLGAKEMIKKTQCEQKSADKAEPKFKSGDWIIGDKDNTVHQVKIAIENVSNGKYAYDLIDGGYISTSHESDYHLWTIQDAREGDVLINWNNTAFIFKAIEDETVKFHIAYNEKWDAIKTPSTKLSHLGLPEPQFEFHPATEEQRDTLFARMHEAGYEWDEGNKELKKIEQKPTQEIVSFEAEHGKYYYCIKDYFCGGKKQASKGDVVQALRGLPIMGLKDASEYFLPVNLIKCNSAWSEEEIEKAAQEWDSKASFTPFYMTLDGNGSPNGVRQDITSHKESFKAGINWILNSLKNRVQPQKEWRQDNVEELTEFENAMMHIGGSFFSENAGLDPNDTNIIKEQANILLGLVPKQEWSEEDEKIYQSIMDDTVQENQLDRKQTDWLRDIKYRHFSQPQLQWKPSDEQMRVLQWCMPLWAEPKSKAILESLINDLKKLKG